MVIGSQMWMKENLNVTHYNNNTPIQKVTDSTAWSMRTSAAYCYWGNDSAQTALYGALYNWYVVHDAGGICPTGWHVPSDDEWSVLVNYAGGDSNAGSHLKVTGNQHWLFKNSDADNSSGFSALPSGHRHTLGSFATLGYHTFWWSSTGTDSACAWKRHVSYDNTAVGRSVAENTTGFCIRCVSNQPVQTQEKAYTPRHRSTIRMQQIRPNMVSVNVKTNGSKLSLFNSRGQRLYHRELQKGQQLVDVGFLAKGSYILCLTETLKTIRTMVVVY